MTIKMIAAIGLDRSLGYQNELLWDIKSDMEFFKELTTGKTVVMGSKTYQSIGKPLVNRKNIVLSRDKDLKVNSKVTVLDSIAAVLADYDDFFVVGGESIYKQFLPFTDKLFLTIVEAKFPHADTYFPELSQDWKCTKKHFKEADEHDEYSHWYCVYERIKA